MPERKNEVESKKPTVLFLCSRNSARSQMAEGILKSLAGDRMNVLSAGLSPSAIHPLTVEVMSEIGISLDDHRSKSISEYLGRVSINHAIIVCASVEAHCPSIYPFALQVHYWPFDDPAAVEGDQLDQLDQLEAFRTVRDEIREKLISWLQIE